MRRSFDDIRNILLTIEGCTGDCRWRMQKFGMQLLEGTPVAGVSKESLAFHVPLLLEGKLITARVSETADIVSWSVVRLTWAGHEFLDTIRMLPVWNRLRSIFADPQLQTANFDLWASVAAELVRQQVRI